MVCGSLKTGDSLGVLGLLMLLFTCYCLSLSGPQMPIRYSS